MEIKPASIYFNPTNQRHYLMMGRAMDSERGLTLIIYQDIQDKQIWATPEDVFVKHPFKIVG